MPHAVIGSGFLFGMALTLEVKARSPASTWELLQPLELLEAKNLGRQPPAT